MRVFLIVVAAFVIAVGFVGIYQHFNNKVDQSLRLPPGYTLEYNKVTKDYRWLKKGEPDRFIDRVVGHKRRVIEDAWRRYNFNENFTKDGNWVKGGINE